jgi:hypothetical protein
MRKILPIAAAVFLCVSLPAQALECMEPELEAAAKSADAVFKGHITEIKRNYEGSVVGTTHFEKSTVRVDTPIKGSLKEGDYVEVVSYVWRAMQDSNQDWAESANNVKEGIFVLNHPTAGEAKENALGPEIYFVGKCGVLMWPFTPENIIRVETAQP